MARIILGPLVRRSGLADAVSPVVTGVQAINITNTSFVVSWTTNEVSTSQVDYGTTTGYTLGPTTLDSGKVKTHLVSITGLNPSTLYYFRVRSTDLAGNATVGTGYSITTSASGVDTTAPVITDVTAYNVTTTTATISWSLDEYATGQVEYGLTAAYGTLGAAETSFLYNGHVQTISSLLPGRTYNYRVRSQDASGNLALSGNNTFTTASAGTASVYGPAFAMDAKNNYQPGQNGASGSLVAMRFKALTTTSVASVCWAHRTGTGGYSGGTGGTLELSIQPDSGGFPSGTKLATATWVPGNPGAGGYLKRLAFGSPPSITAGQYYHAVWTNTDASPTVNFVSVNFAFTYNLLTPRQPFTTDADLRGAVKVSGVWDILSNDTPDVDVTCADGNHLGNAYFEVNLGYTAVFGGTSNLIRERFTVTGGNRTVTKVWARVGRQAGTGPITFRLESSSGTLIEQGSVAAGTAIIAYTAGALAVQTGTWLSYTFTTPRVLTNGLEYRMVMSAPAGSEYTMVSCRYENGDTDQLLSRAFTDGLAELTANGGSSWAKFYLYADLNMQFYFETQ